MLLSLFILTYSQYYDGFFFGMFIADGLKQEWLYGKTRNWQRKTILPVLALLAGLGLTYPFYGARSFWANLKSMGWPDGSFLTPYIPMTSAMILFLLVMISPTIQKKLETPILVYLGKISFALYVLHFLLLGSLSAWAVYRLTPFLGYDMAVLTSLVISFPILIWSSSWATSHIDHYAIQTSYWFNTIVMKGILIPYKFLQKRMNKQ